MANTESLIIELDARTAKLDAQLKSTDAKLNSLAKSTVYTDKSLDSMSKTSDELSGTLTGLAATATAVAASIGAMSVRTAEYAKEIKIASQLSGVAAEELQVMALATSTVGIGLEQLGDISKDTQEKIGEFTSDGTGGFLDFISVMGLTQDEAEKLAAEFTQMSGPDVLQEMVRQMDEAGKTSQEMSFALESVASESTRLIPLLINNAEEFNALSDAMRQVTVPLTKDDIKKITDAGTAALIARKSFTSLTDQIIADLAPAFQQAAENAAFFYATLNEGTEAQIISDLAKTSEKIKELTIAIQEREQADLKAYQSASLWDALNPFSDDVADTQLMRDELVKLEEEYSRLQELYKESAGLTPPSDADIESERKKLEEAAKLKEKIDAEQAKKELDKAREQSEKLDAIKLDQEKRERARIEERFKSEEELLTERYEREQELFAGNKEALLALESEYIDNIIELDDKAEQARLKSNRAVEQDKIKRDKGEIKSNEILTDALLDSAATIFEDNKEIQAGIIVAHTAAGVMNQFTTGDPYTAWARAIAVGAEGALQLANAQSASKGGGGSTSVSAAPAESTQDQANVSVTSFESGGQQNTIQLVGNGDELIDALASALTQRQIDGRA